MFDQQSTPKLNQLYQSYLVRLWQEDQQAPWRILVQSIQSGETLHFADLESFLAFIATQTASKQPAVDHGQAESGEVGQ